ncbi:MAG: glucose-6-phosphate isomerase [Saprospiraceae bacterium]
MQLLHPGNLEAEIKKVYSSFDEKKIANLLFDKDPTLWKDDPEQVKDIRQRLGWLTLPELYLDKANEITTFALQVKEDGFTHIVLLGMGGSSLSSEVARETFGSSQGFPVLFVLDNTAPEAILDLENKINLEHTLFIVASKSGGTEETISFFKYFYAQLQKTNDKNPGNHFVAITDDNTSLVKVAAEHNFRKVFINPSDLGGRYSVLSDFGLVPMALIGIDIVSFLTSAKRMQVSCNDGRPAEFNPGISLGVLLGIWQQHGRDKVTFILSSSISSFGYWVEQLIAESTGKEGKGLIPVVGESLGHPEEYGPDRIFVNLCLNHDDSKEASLKTNALEAAGHPVIRITMDDKVDLGSEYYRWEVATAIAGLVMKINPFDQPNVEESKQNTKLILEKWNKEGSFKISAREYIVDDFHIYEGHRENPSQIKSANNVGGVVNQFTAQAKTNDYIAMLPYFMMNDHRENVLQAWREKMRDELKVATTLLNGPRYLHSTGQLHKGGPDTGLFIILVGEHEADLAIPGSTFGFAILHEAQALGDFQSLDDKGRRVIYINLGADIDAGLSKLFKSISISNTSN